MVQFPMLDAKATGENIDRLRRACGYSVREVQQFFAFDYPQTVYNWLRGRAIPKVDHLYALGVLFGVPIDEILVGSVGNEVGARRWSFIDFERMFYQKYAMYQAGPILCTMLPGGRICVS
jgi:transcriptional regulator with XRE-family HTH domain